MYSISEHDFKKIIIALQVLRLISIFWFEFVVLYWQNKKEKLFTG